MEFVNSSAHQLNRSKLNNRGSSQATGACPDSIWNFLRNINDNEGTRPVVYANYIRVKNRIGTTEIFLCIMILAGKLGKR